MTDDKVGNIRLLTCAGTLLVMACAAASAPTTAAPATPVVATPTPDVRLRIPEAIGPFAIIGRHAYKDRSAGYQLRYRGPENLVADVFVYPGPDFADECPAACAQKVFDNEVSSFRDGLSDMIARGHADSASVTMNEPLTRDSTALWRLGHHVRLAIRRDNLAQRSEFYLFYLPIYRVKVRATFVETPGQTAALQGFVKEIIPALAGPSRQ